MPFTTNGVDNSRHARRSYMRLNDVLPLQRACKTTMQSQNTHKL